MAHLCDTHCHLYLDQFQDDLAEVVQNAHSQGVKKILVPAIDLDSCQQALELCLQYPGLIYAAAGIHPNYAKEDKKQDIAAINELLSSSNEFRAIGEVGLDFYRTWASIETQEAVFKEMLALAVAHCLPICLHVRESGDEIINLLEPWYAQLISASHPLAESPGVFHSFEGNHKLARWAIEHQFYLGISGTVTYKKSNRLRDIVSEVGLEHLILETDAPYLSPQPVRGQRNNPGNVNFVVDEIAHTLACGRDLVVEVTSQNAGKLFKWDIK